MNRPLAGCRVLDLGIITAGAATAALLADLGADVIKLESESYRDPFRLWASQSAGSDPDAPHPFFRLTNRGKRGLGLDLKREEGRAAFLRLVAECDVVVENFRRGVLEKLRIDFPLLREANPNIILMSISSQGATGPDAAYVSYGSTLEAVAGLASLSGYEGDAPAVSGREVNLPDQVVAIFAAGMVTTAWLHRQNGGGGACLDLSQRELTSFLVGEAFAGSGPAKRHGNSEPAYAIQDCFRAADGKYMAVSVTEPQRSALTTLTGPATLQAWCASQLVDAAVKALSEAGIAAAPVLDGRGMMEGHGALWEHALVQSEDHGLLKGFPFQYRNAPLDTQGDAPAVGADTIAILSEVGGFSADEIEALLESGAASVAAIHA